MTIAAANEGSGGPVHSLSFTSLDTDSVEVHDGDTTNYVGLIYEPRHVISNNLAF